MDLAELTLAIFAGVFAGMFCAEQANAAMRRIRFHNEARRLAKARRSPHMESIDSLLRDDVTLGSLGVITKFRAPR